ncbi:MAG: YidC/Oxa1 family membrane protein insertase [Patescibacteria group bacterium]|nr:YidC/Oxa1 family membrane protein insertase [bacterium]MDZ4241052.1 YidC/Oxa1 family membrane protein insertase [Patescibacteria group bacterium]
MISSFFHTFFYQPLYNGLILLIDFLPWFDVGIIVVLFTIIIKMVLFPLSRKSLHAQQKLKILEPKISEIKGKIKDQQAQAEQIIALYKENGVNPFMSILLAFIQFPIIFALYFIFAQSGLPSVDTGILYSFVGIPQNLNMIFLGIFDVTKNSLILAVIVGVSSFFQMRISLPAPAPGVQENELAKSMRVQMKYILPVMMGFFAYQISSAVSLYWATSNLFTIGQEMLLKRKPKE